MQKKDILDIYACLVLLSHLNINEEREIKIENKREEKTNT
jgi:hypothetical protein